MNYTKNSLCTLLTWINNFTAKKLTMQNLNRFYNTYFVFTFKTFTEPKYKAYFVTKLKPSQWILKSPRDVIEVKFSLSYLVTFFRNTLVYNTRNIFLWTQLFFKYLILYNVRWNRIKTESRLVYALKMWFFFDKTSNFIFRELFNFEDKKP